MAPRTETQYKEIRQEKKTLIMQVALELFANGGYHKTSISKIASKAGISKGLLYNYFESKEKLIREIIFKAFEDFIYAFDPNKDGVLTEDELEFFIEEMFRIIKSNTNLWKIYFALFLQPEVYGIVREEIMKMLQPVIGTIMGYFQRKGRGDPEVEMRCFIALLDGLAFHYMIDIENFPLDKIKKKILDLYK